MQNIYTISAESFGISGAQLPLNEERFRRSLSARGMVDASRGLGGPQLSEVNRMLSEERKRLNSDRSWLELQRAKLLDADAGLQKAFAELLKSAD